MAMHTEMQEDQAADGDLAIHPMAGVVHHHHHQAGILHQVMMMRLREVRNRVEVAVQDLVFIPEWGSVHLVDICSEGIGKAAGTVDMEMNTGIEGPVAAIITTLAMVVVVTTVPAPQLHHLAHQLHHLQVALILPQDMAEQAEDKTMKECPA